MHAPCLDTPGRLDRRMLKKQGTSEVVIAENDVLSVRQGAREPPKMDGTTVIPRRQRSATER